MALFPLEFIASILVALVQVRLRSSFSLASLLISGLTFFLPPEQELLNKLNGLPEKAHLAASTGRPTQKPHPLSPQEKLQQFYVKCGTTEHGVFQQTLFYEIYETLVILVSSTLFGSLVGNVLAILRPVIVIASDVVDGAQPELSFYGLLTCVFISLWFPLQITLAQGFATDEARLSYLVGFFAFMLSFFVMLAPDHKIVDFSVESAIKVLGSRGEIAVKSLGINNSEVLLMRQLGGFLKVGAFMNLGLAAAAFACTSFLPAFRFARMYFDMTADPERNIFWKMLLHVHMILPLVGLVLWIKPLATDVFVPKTLVPCHEKALYRDCFASTEDEVAFNDSIFAMKESSFQLVRIGVCLAIVLLKLLTFREHLQAFLMEPKETMLQIVRRPGVVNGDLLRTKVRIQFNYVPILSIQFLAPAIALFASAALFLRQSTIHGFGLFHSLQQLLITSAPMVDVNGYVGQEMVMLPDKTPPDVGGFRIGDELDREKMSALIKGMTAYEFMTPDVSYNLLAFALFWVCFIWFGASVAGLLYWRNMPHGAAQADDDLIIEPRKSRQTPKSLKNQLKSVNKQKKQR